MKKIYYILIIFAFILGFNLVTETQKTEAVTPTINIQFRSADKKSTGWLWVFIIETTNIPKGTPVWVYIYKNNISTENLIKSQTVGHVDETGILEYNTDSILDDNTKYVVNFMVKSTPVVNKSYTNTTGQTQNIKPEEPTNFDPKKDDSNNTKKDDTYTLLAPLGKLETAPKNIGDYFNVIFNLAIGLCAVLAVVMIVIGGIQYMGDESIFGKTEAKSKIFSAILGLIIALGSYALLNTINPDLLGKKGVHVETVSIELDRTSGGGYFGVDIGTPGTPNANKNIVTYDTELKSAAQKYGLDCTLIKAFMYAESGGVNGKTSPAGAGGLMQLMPATFKEQGYEVSKIMDPLTNIMAGASYLNKLKNNGCNGSSKSSVCDISNIQYLAASYNGGPGANKESPDCDKSTLWRCTKYNGYKETRIYAPRVEANFKKLKEKGWGC